MSFVLDELIFIMFLIFTLSFTLFIVVGYYKLKKIVKKPNDFTKTLGITIAEEEYIFSPYIKVKNHDLLKEKFTHFTER